MQSQKATLVFAISFGGNKVGFLYKYSSLISAALPAYPENQPL